MDKIDLLNNAISNLDATDDEKHALHQILDVEGFGGREDDAISDEAAREIAEEKLVWYRDQREEGLR